MYKFAKVVISNGREVLFMKNKKNVDGVDVPKLSIIFHTDDEAQVDVGVVLPDSSDESWDKLDSTFDSLDDAEAQKLADNITCKIEPGMSAFDLISVL
jgi:hypothetical protein